MKSKINLVVLTPGFAADEKDSTAIPALQLFLGNFHSLHPEINIRIISFHYPFYRRNYIWKGIQVHAAGGTQNKYLKIFLWIRILICLFKIRKTNGIDIIHTFWLTETTLIGLLFGRLTGIHVVSTAMGQDIKKPNRYLSLIRLFNINLITISEFQANYIHGFVRTKLLKVNPFGVDLSYFQQKHGERNIDILAVASLNKTKNHLHFIDIIASLVQVFPGLVCGIIGEGNEREQIEQLLLKNGLEKRIELFGQLPYEEVIKKMQSCKILLHTSIFEGQGGVITEALASGAYVVCYRVGIAWNLVNKKLRTGRNKAELEQHLKHILLDKIPDYSQEILFTIEDTCSVYNKIYHTLVSAKRYDSH